MHTFYAMTRRNIKMYFRDKGMFLSSLISPLILLVLYATFLAKVYRESFESAIAGVGIEVPARLIDGTVAAQLVTSLLAVCTVTVAFCSNMLMVQDRVTGTRRDLMITPTRRSTLALSYYAATLFSALIVGTVTFVVCLLYQARVGWYLTFGDVMLVFADILLLSLFGTALSSLVNVFLTSEGQISAVGTVVSAGYGFICGAYMPIASFGVGLRRALMFLPGTYGTALLRNHAMRGVYEAMKAQGFPAAAIEGIRDGIDCNLYFFSHSVPVGVMYAVMAGAILLLVGAYVLAAYLTRRRT